MNSSNWAPYRTSKWLPRYWPDKGLKGSVVNRACPSCQLYLSLQSSQVDGNNIPKLQVKRMFNENQTGTRFNE